MMSEMLWGFAGRLNSSVRTSVVYFLGSYLKILATFFVCKDRTRPILSNIIMVGPVTVMCVNYTSYHNARKIVLNTLRVSGYLLNM